MKSFKQYIEETTLSDVMSLIGPDMGIEIQQDEDDLVIAHGRLKKRIRREDVAAVEEYIRWLVDRIERHRLKRPKPHTQVTVSGSPTTIDYGSSPVQA